MTKLSAEQKQFLNDLSNFSYDPKGYHVTLDASSLNDLVQSGLVNKYTAPSGHPFYKITYKGKQALHEDFMNWLGTSTALDRPGVKPKSIDSLIEQSEKALEDLTTKSIPQKSPKMVQLLSENTTIKRLIAETQVKLQDLQKKLQENEKQFGIEYDKNDPVDYSGYPRHGG